MSLTRIHDIQQLLVGFLEEARQAMISTSDQHRVAAPILNVGDRVWLNMKNMKSVRPCSKMDYKRQGPFTIIERRSPLAFKLRLPDSMRLVHPVFHVNLLEPVVENTLPNRVIPPPPPTLVESFMEFEVEEVLDSAVKRGKVRYLVKWLGFDTSENTWLLGSELAHANELLNTFHLKYPSKPNWSTHLKTPARSTRKPTPVAVTTTITDKAFPKSGFNAVSEKSVPNRKRKVTFEDKPLATGGNARTRADKLARLH